MNKPEWVAKEVAKTVNAGKEWDLETVDFSDPNRPLTCLEVDFPIIPINQIAAIEGNAGKPIYQMSKWWARRRSSVFRSLLLAAATKAPDDPSEAAKLVWDAYYGNHQKRGAFKDLIVADVFMGGGTTVVEGSRLGMQMYGNDLNPIAWFITKNELAQVNKSEVEALLADIEKEVKPQIMPFYSCDCPRGHAGKWTKTSSGEVMPPEFDPLELEPEQRQDYSYEGPEIVYAFWIKHGPCSVSDCGHRTPIVNSPVLATKSLSVKHWSHKCSHCGNRYDVEEFEPRMAPGIPLFVAPGEPPFAHLEGLGAQCPICHKRDSTIPEISRTKPKKKKVALTLLAHPRWLKGEQSRDSNGIIYGGRANDSAEATRRWNQVRAEKSSLLEVRGPLPPRFICPNTGSEIVTGEEAGTVPKKGHFACSACGTTQDVLASVKLTGDTAPTAICAIQGYCPTCDNDGLPYGGRFFTPVDDATSINAATQEWELRREGDLHEFWPTSELSKGWKTHGWAIPEHGYTHYWKMFNPRQLLLHSVLLKSITGVTVENYANFILGGFQQYLRNQCMFSFWNIQADKLEPHLSNNNFHPKSMSIENGVFAKNGRGNWASQKKNLLAAAEWARDPWELVSNEHLSRECPTLSGHTKGKSEKAFPGDPVNSTEAIWCGTSTDLHSIESGVLDAVVTDPPFGGIMQYAELGDFFYVWLRLALARQFPSHFESEYSPKTLEAVTNPYRNPDNPDTYYQRLLTQCWSEAYRALRPGGLLAFTFHHNDDKAWVAVLESLFDAGFALEATYPIRGDETKGDGSFGSQKIEFDIIHVCRKRTVEPAPISWAKLRKQVLHDVKDLQSLLEHHQKSGLPEADLQVIRRGKALQYYSRHYGKVFKDPNTPLSVLEALLGINQLLEEEAGGIKEAPPHNAEPFTRMLLRLFDGIDQLPRDQMQKFLRGTGSAPSDYVSRGWTTEKSKIFYLTPPLEIARNWIGKLRRGMTSDYDQAMFLIGACIEGSGINANETLNNDNFLPHPALGSIVTWYKTHGADNATRNAAIRAQQLYQIWESKNQKKVTQLSLFESLGEEGA